MSAVVWDSWMAGERFPEAVELRLPMGLNQAFYIIQTWARHVHKYQRQRHHILYGMTMRTRDDGVRGPAAVGDLSCCWWQCSSGSCVSRLPTFNILYRQTFGCWWGRLNTAAHCWTSPTRPSRAKPIIKSPALLLFVHSAHIALH